VVDKSQRGGGREIYVMDYITKLYQHPIEKFFKCICEYIDNEIISVSSARRAGLIHHKCFEYKNEKYDTYYMTMDCRKWAPRNNPDKYLFMIAAMQDVLPYDFILHVFNYFQYHRGKSIKTRIQIKEKLLKNPINQKYQKYFSDNLEEGSSEFIMPYSFVMGIFNMLSSLFHAGCQIYIKNILEASILKKNINVDIDLYAHSDDSAGRISIEKNEKTEELLNKILTTYEFTQKTANHLISFKKYNISKNYFELLSILYMNDELLPLIMKFCSNITLSFTGLGLSSDFKQIISKSIELQQNGATASQSYKAQIIMSNMYRNFYRVKTPTNLPSLGGFCNNWPNLYTAYGAASDEVYVSRYNTNFYQMFMSFAEKHLEYEAVDGSLNLSYHNIIRKSRAYLNFQKIVKLPEILDKEWFFQNNKTRHSLLNIWWFRAMLQSNNFSVSLLNVNEIRRLYDTLYMASTKSIKGKFENFDINNLIYNILNTEPKITNFEKTLKTMYYKLYDYLDWLDTITEPTFIKKQRLTFKPSSLSITNFADTPIVDYNSLILSCEMLDKKLLRYTYSNKYYGSEIEIMKKYLESKNIIPTVRDYKNFLDFMKKSRSKDFFFYTETLSKQRVYNNNQGLYDLTVNSFHSKYTIAEKSARFIEDRILKIKFDATVIDYCLAAYLYNIFKTAKLYDLMTVKLKGNFPDNTYLNNLFSTTSQTLIDHSSLSFTSLMENLMEKSININNFNNYALFTKKQGKIGVNWIGLGEIIFNLEGVLIKVYVKNRDIYKLEVSDNNYKIFNYNTMVFFLNLLGKFDINFYQQITPLPDKKYFGLNRDNVLGLFNGIDILIGIQDTCYNNSITLPTKGLYEFKNGYHYVKFHRDFNKIYTMDTEIFSKNNKLIFSIIDFDVLTNIERNRVMEVLFEGKYGDFNHVEYIKQDLIDNFIKTDLYKLLYNKVIKENTNLNDVFWNDILTSIEFTNEIFPVLFERFDYKELSSILPDEAKQRVTLNMFFNQNDENVMLIRNKLKSIDDENERFNYFINIVSKVKDKYGIILLPEVGDIESFKLYNNPKTTNILTVLNLIDTLSTALLTGYKYLKEKNINKLFTKYNYNINTKYHLIKLFTRHTINRYNYFDSTNIMTNCNLFIHDLMSEIFEDNEALIEFSYVFRRSFFRNIPRHPRYLNEWQSIVACCFTVLTLRLNENIIQGQSNEIKKSFITRLPKKYPINRITDLTEPITNQSSLIHPVINLIMDVSQKLISEDVTYMDLQQNDLTNLEGDIRNTSKIMKNLKDLYEDVISEEDDLEFFKYTEKKKTLIVELEDLERLSQFSHNDKICAVTPIFISVKNVCCIKIQNEFYFAYNLNADIQKNLGFNNVNKNIHIDYNKYIAFYDFNNSKIYDYKLLNNKINVVTNEAIESLHTFDQKLLNLKNNIDMHSSEIYNKELSDILTKQFELTLEESNELLKLVELKKSPVIKYGIIKDFLQQKESNKINKDFDIDKVIREFNKKIKIEDLIQTDEKTNVISSLIATDRNPNRLIGKLTNYKKEFKQANVLMDKLFGSFITKSIKLPRMKVKNLQMQLRLIKTQIRRKDHLKNIYELCNFILEQLKDLEGDIENNEGRSFDETIRTYINEIGSLIDEVNEEDLLFHYPPEEDYFDWNFKLK